MLKRVQENWSKHLNGDIAFATVTTGFKNIKTIAPSVYQHFNNFMLLHRRMVLINLSIKIGILVSETPKCKTGTETIEHTRI